jgi:hypothetical protein
MQKRKFTIEKEVEWKQGKINTWFYIKLIDENNSSTFIDIATDEVTANQLFEAAVNNYIKPSKTIIREYEVEESK